MTNSKQKYYLITKCAVQHPIFMSCSKTVVVERNIHFFFFFFFFLTKHRLTVDNPALEPPHPYRTRQPSVNTNRGSVGL